MITKEGKVWNGTKFLRGFSSNGGYIIYDLYFDGKRAKIYSHRLVMEVYNGASELHVHHIDGNKTNNSLNNLEYVTHIENQNKLDKSPLQLPFYISKTSNRGKWTTYSYRRTINGKRVTLKTSSKLNTIIQFKKHYELQKPQLQQLHYKSIRNDSSRWY